MTKERCYWSKAAEDPNSTTGKDLRAKDSKCVRCYGLRTACPERLEDFDYSDFEDITMRPSNLGS